MLEKSGTVHCRAIFLEKWLQIKWPTNIHKASNSKTSITKIFRPYASASITYYILRFAWYRLGIVVRLVAHSDMAKHGSAGTQ